MTHFALMRPLRHEIRPGHAVVWRGKKGGWHAGEVINNTQDMIECRQRIPRMRIDAQLTLVPLYRLYSVVTVEDPL